MSHLGRWRKTSDHLRQFDVADVQIPVTVSRSNLRKVLQVTEHLLRLCMMRNKEEIGLASGVSISVDWDRLLRCRRTPSLLFSGFGRL